MVDSVLGEGKPVSGGWLAVLALAFRVAVGAAYAFPWVRLRTVPAGHQLRSGTGQGLGLFRQFDIAMAAARQFRAGRLAAVRTGHGGKVEFG